jgi:hypothetical protein
VYRKSGQVSDLNTNDTDAQQRQPEPLRLTDQYIALLVLIFTNAGLLEVGCWCSHLRIITHISQALTSMFQETTTGSNLSRKGTLLMAEVLQLANKVLPLSLAAKIQVSAHSISIWRRWVKPLLPSSLSQMSSSWPQTTNAENTESSAHQRCHPLTVSIETELG